MRFWIVSEPVNKYKRKFTLALTQQFVTAPLPLSYSADYGSIIYENT